MIVGDRIKLLHKMGAFDNIGEICEVTDITEDGVICFKFGGCHLGCMSYNEFEKYFEKVEDRPSKRVITIVATYVFDDAAVEEVEISDRKVVEKMVHKWATDYFGDEEIPMLDLKVTCEDFYKDN